MPTSAELNALPERIRNIITTPVTESVEISGLGISQNLHRTLRSVQGRSRSAKESGKTLDTRVPLEPEIPRYDALASGFPMLRSHGGEVQGTRRWNWIPWQVTECLDNIHVVHNRQGLIFRQVLYEAETTIRNACVDDRGDIVASEVSVSRSAVTPDILWEFCRWNDTFESIIRDSELRRDLYVGGQALFRSSLLIPDLPISLPCARTLVNYIVIWGYRSSSGTKYITWAWWG